MKRSAGTTAKETSSTEQHYDKGNSSTDTKHYDKENSVQRCDTRIKRTWIVSLIMYAHI